MVEINVISAIFSKYHSFCTHELNITSNFLSNPIKILLLSTYILLPATVFSCIIIFTQSTKGFRWNGTCWNLPFGRQTRKTQSRTADTPFMTHWKLNRVTIWHAVRSQVYSKHAVKAGSFLFDYFTVTDKWHTRKAIFFPVNVCTHSTRIGMRWVQQISTIFGRGVLVIFAWAKKTVIFVTKFCLWVERWKPQFYKFLWIQH